MYICLSIYLLSIYLSTCLSTPTELRDRSCRGYVESDSEGGYGFTTTVPPAHGPPRCVCT